MWYIGYREIFIQLSCIVGPLCYCQMNFSEGKCAVLHTICYAGFIHRMQSPAEQACA